MQKIIENFTQPAIGQKVWHIRQELGSMIKFEIGKRIEVDQGEYHFWVQCSHWWLRQGESQDFEDIVCSESNKHKIAEKLTVLEGKKLVRILFKPEDASTNMDFEDGLSLLLLPYGKNEFGDEPSEVEQWFIFHAGQILSVFSDGTVTVKNANEA